MDLRLAEFRVGDKAYNSGVLLSGHEDLAAELIDVQLSLVKLKETVPSSPEKNLSVKVERRFRTAGRAIRWLVLVDQIGPDRGLNSRPCHAFQSTSAIFQVLAGRISIRVETCGTVRKQKCGLLWRLYIQIFFMYWSFSAFPRWYVTRHLRVDI
jgi:hypothetical protein